MHIFHVPVDASLVGLTQLQFLLNRLPISANHYLADIMYNLTACPPSKAMAVCCYGLSLSDRLSLIFQADVIR